MNTLEDSCRETKETASRGRLCADAKHQGTPLFLAGVFQWAQFHNVPVTVNIFTKSSCRHCPITIIIIITNYIIIENDVLISK